MPENHNFSDYEKQLELLGDQDPQVRTDACLYLLDVYGMGESRFLLPEGTPCPLPREPSFIYLLPPLGRDTNLRFLLALYPCQNEQPPALQLLKWFGNYNQAEVEPGAEPTPIEPNEARIATERRLLSISAREDEFTGQTRVYLKFETGLVQLETNADGSIGQVTWIDRPAPAPVRRVERSSWGAMPAVLEIQDSENWRDDAVYQPGGLRFKVNFPLGKVRGADAQGIDMPVYMASNLACMVRVTAGGEAAKTTDRLGGIANDVLVSPLPEKEGETAILACTQDGATYFLKDVDGSLHILFQQQFVAPLIRLTGRADGHLLAMDQHAILRPLRLICPRSGEEIWSKTVFDLTADVPETETRDGNQDRLLLERALLSLSTDGFPTEAMARIERWLASSYLDDVGANPRANFHYQVLKRLYAWMRVETRRTRTNTETISPDPERLAALLRLLRLPEDAPERLCLYTLRHHDRVPLLRDAWKLGAVETVEQAIEGLQNDTLRVRRTLLPAMHQVRPLSLRGGARFAGQIRHLRQFPNANDLLVFWEHPGHLRVVRLPSDPAQPWLQVAALEPEMHGLQGLCTTLLVHPNLAGFHSGSHANEPHVLLASNRGELVLYRLVQDRLQIVNEWHCDLAVACGLPVQHAAGLDILLGGTDSKGKPAIWNFPLQQPNKQPFHVWEGKELGQIRMLRQDNSSRLWAIEREQGRLLLWEAIDKTLQRRVRFKLIEPATRLKRADHFHALEIDDRSAEEQQLFCGANSGVGYSLRAGDGRLAWLTGCRQSLRRAAWLPTWKAGEGAWVVAGDGPHVLILNRQGRLAGLIEDIGPITTLCVMADGHLLAGGIDGRINLFDASTPASQIRAMPRLDLWPMQCDGEVDPDELLRLAPRMESVEPLDSLALLQKLMKALERDTYHREVDYREIAKGLSEHPLRLAWFLRHLDDQGNPAWEKFAEAAWEIMAETKTPREPLCQWFNALLEPLERIALEAPDNERALLNKLDTCLWNSQGCPDWVEKSRLTMLRVSQAQRAWVANTVATTEGSATLLSKWFQRLNALWRTSTEADFSVRMKCILEAKLPWLAGDDNAWLDWLEHLAGAEKGALPTPLDVLLAPSLSPLVPGQIDALSSLWPDTPGWRIWVEELGQRLRHWREKQQATLPFAWEERQALTQIGGHVWTSPFRLDDHPLLALLWPRLRDAWRRLLEQRQNQLDEKALSEDQPHINLSCQDRWLEGGQVELRLALTNRTPYELKLAKVYWSGQPLQIPAFTLAESRSPAELTIPLGTTELSELSGRLRLEFRDQMRSRLSVLEHTIRATRDVDAFTSEPEWQPTWKRLSRLLDARRPLYWLQGHVWPSREHTRLAYLVRTKYGVDVYARAIKRLGEVPDEHTTVFSPDLALGASSARLLEEVHALFHGSTGSRLDWAAMSCWRMARPGEWSVALELALARYLLPAEQIRRLLARLLGGTHEYRLAELESELAGLPVEALGAWCMGETLYVGQAEAMAYYADNASAMGWAFWQAVDPSAVPLEEEARFLGADIGKVEDNRQRRQAVYPLFGQDMKLRERGAQVLLESFGGKALASGGVWRSDTPVELHYVDYPHLYLVMPDTSPQQRGKLEKQSPGLWLALDDTKGRLPGRVLSLQQDDVLRLVQTPRVQIRAVLNQIAARRASVDPVHVFRTSGGMPGDMVTKHFHGRDEQLAALHACLRAADQGSGAALIVSGRRMGKTSLRQRLEFDLGNSPEARPFVHINCEGMVEQRGLSLSYWFWRQFRTEVENVKKTPAWQSLPTLKWVWTDDKKENADRAQAQLQEIETWLDEVKRKSSHALLLTLDETDWLVRFDALEAPRQSVFPVFSVLRRLIQCGRLCLVATTYPYGLGERGSLNILQETAGTPLYNTFTDVLYLPPWEEATAWAFLRDRLAGLGITLPLRYRDEAWRLTRGVPWVVHALGLALCSGTETGRRLVLPDNWRQTREQVAKQVRTQMQATVIKEVEAADHKYRLGLGEGRLWTALLTVTGKTSTERPGFSTKELVVELHGPHWDETALSHLDVVLRGFASSIVLEGDAERDRYHYPAPLLQVVADLEANPL